MGNNLLDVLTREGVLINVSIRYWRASKKLRPEDLGLDPEDITKLISLGHKKLMSAEALAPFALIEGRAHALVEASTFPFLGGLARFLPNSKLMDVTDKLNLLEREFSDKRMAFQANYGKLREAAVREWRLQAKRLGTHPDQLMATIEQAFPHTDQLEGYFRFQTHLFQVKIPERLSVDLVRTADQKKILAAREQAAREASEKIRRDVNSFVADCVATLRQETSQLCEEMLTSMRSGKSGVHQKTLNRMLTFMDRVKDLNFAGDQELTQELEAFKQEFLGSVAQEYRDDGAARQRLAQGIRNLADTTKNLARQDANEIVAKFGQMGVRKFTLAA